MNEIENLKMKLEETAEFRNFFGITNFGDKRLEISRLANMVDQKLIINDHKLLLGLGINEIALGKAAAAHTYFSRASDRAAENEDVGTFIAANQSIAALYGAADDLDNAAGIYLHLYDFCKRLNLLDNLASVASGLGSAYARQNILDLALKYHSEAVSLYRELGDKSGESMALINIGGTCRRKGSLDDALKYWNEAREILVSLGDNNAIVRLDEEIGSLQRGD